MIEIEESKDERSITAHELRLRFRRVGDRWTDELDIGPVPWKLAVEVVEWRSDDGLACGPIYQDVRFERDGNAVTVIATGRVGDHDYSAKFRVSDRMWWKDHFAQANIVQERFESRIEVEVTDQCLDPIGPVEVRYLVKKPPAELHLGDSRDDEPEGFSRAWSYSLMWEAAVADNHHLLVTTRDKARPSQVSMTAFDADRGWSVRVAPVEVSTRGTTQFSYAWEHERCRVWERTADGLKIQGP